MRTETCPICDEVHPAGTSQDHHPPGLSVSGGRYTAHNVKPTYTLKDSGARQSFDSGMVRDTTDGKIDYSLVLDGPLFERYAAHLTKGAVKYEVRNWMKAAGQEELDRFRSSAFRHFLQWYRGDTDEDHMAAVVFNLNGAEFVREKLGE